MNSNQMNSGVTKEGAGSKSTRPEWMKNLMKIFHFEVYIEKCVIDDGSELEIGFLCTSRLMLHKSQSGRTPLEAVMKWREVNQHTDYLVVKFYRFKYENLS
jgi:hypothetical protein